MPFDPAQGRELVERRLCGEIVFGMDSGKLSDYRFVHEAIPQDMDGIIVIKWLIRANYHEEMS